MSVALPWLSPHGRAVVNALLATVGQAVSVDELATRIGVGNRFRLARLLRREGLPPCGELADWTCALQLLWEAESSGISLLQIADHSTLDPSTCYRLFKRVLGVPWRAARARGFSWALLAFLDRCHRPARQVRARDENSACTRPPGARYATRLRGAVPRGPTVVGVRLSALRGLATSAPRPGGARHPQGNLEGELRLSERPCDVAVSPEGAVFATRAYAATIERLDVRGLRSVSSVPVGCIPTRMAFDHWGRRLYVTNQFSDTISVVDVATNRRIREIAVQGDPAPLVLAPDGVTLYVTTHADQLHAIDLRTDRVNWSFPLPAASHHLTVHPNGRLLYVATRAAGSVIEIEMQTGKMVRTFVPGGQTQALAVEAHGAELYVANEAGGLDVVDLTTGTVSASLQLDGPAFGLALSPDNAQLYVGLVSSGLVQVVDRATLRVLRTIRTGGKPREIAFDPRGTTALIANEAGWVSVVT